jgi:hypothetical protein
VVFDHVLVERVSGEITLRCPELQLVTWQEPEQVTLPTAVRTVALHDLLNFAVDIE